MKRVPKATAAGFGAGRILSKTGGQGGGGNPIGVRSEAV